MALQVKIKIVCGGYAVASSLLRNCNCAALLILSASSTSTRWNPDRGMYQHCRITSSTAETLHCCEGMWWSSADSVSASASAIVVFPTPGGPTNNHADGYGFAANLRRIFFGFSKPAKSAIVRGRYLSASD